MVLFTSLVTAQTHRFIYEYKYIPNIKEKDSVRKDLMALDINEKGSVYRSVSKMQQDSAMQAKIMAMSKNMGGGSISVSGGNLTKGTVGYKVTKEYPNYSVFLTETAGGDTYKISEDKKQNWKISSETKKIGNYNAQKATTDFGGRSWIAWFSTDLPFPDGPYKFHGLPGLIVQLEDTTGSHIMTLVANKNIATPEDDTKEKKVGDVTFSFGKKEIPVTETQFKKAWKSYIADPAKDIRSRGTGSSSTFGNETTISTFIYKDANGKNIDPKDMVKIVESNVKKMLEANNNRIEPSLFE